MVKSIRISCFDLGESRAKKSIKLDFHPLLPFKFHQISAKSQVYLEFLSDISNLSEIPAPNSDLRDAGEEITSPPVLYQQTYWNVDRYFKP